MCGNISSVQIVNFFDPYISYVKLFPHINVMKFLNSYMKLLIHIFNI